MSKVVQDAIPTILSLASIECPFKMPRTGCKKNPNMPACGFDGKCCSWLITNFPKKWLRCRRYKEFSDTVLEAGAS
jgi:hypothetical protein